MSEWKEFSAKTVDEALTDALVELETTSDKVEYEVIEKESSGILGLFSKPAKIRVRLKFDVKDVAADFLSRVFDAMGMDVSVDLNYNESENEIDVDLSGDEMGILIGKRGTTLDSLQYLLSLVVNKNSENYVKVKVDTENYRMRRKETLENLARNLAHKVKKTHKTIYLEPMNPYERRIIHSALQNDKYVETHSEGDEPYRKVVIALKPGVDAQYHTRSSYSYGGGRPYSGKKEYRKRDNYHKEYDDGKRRYDEGYHGDAAYNNTEKNGEEAAEAVSIKNE